MNKSHFLILALTFTAAAQIPAEIKMPALFSDHMVLQQGKETIVWGTGEKGETITVSFGGYQGEAKAGPDGSWKTVLPELKVGDKGELIVKGTVSGNSLRFSDVVVGDVWVCSGQSNMQWAVRQSRDSEAEIAQADHPGIRLFQVEIKPSAEPKKDVVGKWQICSPDTVGTFSAVGYFFGRDLAAETKIPIGLIQSAVGGTPAEAWTPWKSLQGKPEFKALIETREMAVSIPREKIEEEAARIEAEWKRKVDPLFVASDPDPAWFEPQVAGEGWNEVHLPGSIDVQLGNRTEGTFWVRKVFEVPSEKAGDAAVVSLGPVDDFDSTWVNGVLIGQTGREDRQAWNTPRQYPVPAGILKPGTNVLLVRIIDHFQDGGFTGMAAQLYVKLGSGDKIPLTGKALARLETDIGSKPFVPSSDPSNLAGALYDGMIAPLTPFAIRGAIWYQGEANTERAVQYQTLFPKMIQEWRKSWGYEFPFYFVQLASFKEPANKPQESSWAELREAQDMTLSLPKTGMAVAIDLGESRDIHPINKQDVGSRLAKVALAGTYGRDLAASGPRMSNVTVDSGKIRVQFTEIHGGLVAKPVPETYPVQLSRQETAPLVRNSPGSELEGFALCGKDGVWHWADAKIEGDSVVVWSAKVPAPLFVRYNWADFPFGNLYNKAGLPAAPFRTDKPEAEATTTR